MLKLNLEDTGKYEVVTTTDPTTAVDLCENEQPDLIIIDVVMPELSGPAVIKLLKENEKTVMIPIIVASGLGEMVYFKRKKYWKWCPNTDLVKGRGNIVSEKDPEKASEAYGVDNFVPKPYSTDTLVDVIESTLKRLKLLHAEADTQDEMV